MDQKVIYINEEIHARMKSLAAEKKMTLSAFIEMVLADYDKKDS